MVEIIVTNQATIGIAAQLAVFSFVKLLEDWALIPARAGIDFEIAVKLIFADIHNPNFECGISLRIEDQIIQPAPSAFKLLKLIRMDHFIELHGKLLIKLRDH